MNQDKNQTTNNETKQDKNPAVGSEEGLLQKIKEDARQITPPDSLSPEAVEQMLKGSQLHTGRKKPEGRAEIDSISDVEAGAETEEKAEVKSDDVVPGIITGMKSEAGSKAKTDEKPEANSGAKTGTKVEAATGVKADRAYAPRGTGRSKISRLTLRLGSLAAVFTLAIVVVGLAGRISRNSSSQSGDAAQTETGGIVTVLLDEGVGNGEYSTEAYGGSPEIAVTDESAEAVDTNSANEDAVVGENASASDDSADAIAIDGEIADSNNADDGVDSAIDVNASEDASANEDAGVSETESAADDPFTYASSYKEIYDALYEISSQNSVARTLGGIMMVDGDMVIEDAEEEGADGAASDYDTGAVLEDSSSSSASAYSSSSSSEAYLSSDASTATTDSVQSEAALAEEADADDAAEAGEDADYSTTNVQEYGVDEGDVVKTDGSYIYILRTNGEFLIVSVNGENEGNNGNEGTGKAALVSRTSLESDNELTVKEMYVGGDVLSIITREYVTSLVENEDGTYYTTSSNLTVLYTYDISDREEPVLSGTVSQSGYYSDSRKAGNFVYLFSTWYPSVGDTLDDSTLSPLLNGKETDAGSYYLPETLTGTECLVISSVDVTAPSAFVDNKILVSGGDDFYVSQENIYIMNENYENSNTVTEITKFHYEDGRITGVAAGSVTGYLNDSFSMSEYDGNLRVVTTYYGDDLSPTAGVTDWTEHNALYILSESMKQLSVISDLAEGETVRSARFLGDTGYFVTFRQTDPLFSVDLSDPENPQILGELKISGFSSYLHFYGDGLLLGLGYEADEDTGTTTGLKLSMFDISDPSNVTEVAKYVIDGVTWCSSLSNYKSILADAGKNLIGFYCEDRYFLFSYDEEEGFVQEMIYDFYADQLSGEADSDSMRGLYIGDTFYLAGSSFVISFDIDEGFAKTQVLTME
ncbi:MAG: beta-propeller domain-containing protein [Lachnospiraceae bacterium]|nr:beta-propeller domain-containing protein [Lachnospiraceae bacterium]